MPKLSVNPSAALGEFLRQRRRELGLSLRAVEERTSRAGMPIPFATLAKIERGKIEPGVRRLHLLLKLYDVPLRLVADVLELEELADALPEEDDPEKLRADGVQHWKTGDVKAGLAHLFAARRHAGGEREDRVEREKTLLAFAVAAAGSGKYALSRQIAEDLLLEGPDESLKVDLLLQTALCWERLGSVDVALGLLARAAELANPDDHRARARVHHQKAATIASIPGRDEEAEDELLKAQRAYQAANDTYGECKILAVRERILEARGELRRALEAARAARAYAEQHDYQRLACLRALDESRVLLGLGEVQSALTASKEVLAAAISANDPYVDFYAHYGLWKAYQASGARELAELELQAASYYVRFIDEVSEEADEVRGLARACPP